MMGAEYLEFAKLICLKNVSVTVGHLVGLVSANAPHETRLSALLQATSPSYPKCFHVDF